MVEIGEKYRHYKSTGGTDHTYEIVNKAHFVGPQPADMSEVVLGEPIESSSGYIVMSVKEDMGKVLEHQGMKYNAKEMGIFQMDTFTENEEVIIYKPLYTIEGFPPHVSVIVRSTADFIGNVLKNDQSIPRFTQIQS